MTDGLKARLQAGETGRDVDLMFHRWLTQEDWEHHHAYMGYWCKSDKQRQQNPPKAIRYTTSIDAAMGAVPVGWHIQHIHYSKSSHELPIQAHVCVQDNAVKKFRGHAVTTGLTLPAAILLAVIDARENQ